MVVSLSKKHLLCCVCVSVCESVCVGEGGWLAGWAGRQAGSRWAGVHAYACVCVS